MKSSHRIKFPTHVLKCPASLGEGQMPSLCGGSRMCGSAHHALPCSSRDLHKRFAKNSHALQRRRSPRQPSQRSVRPPRDPKQTTATAQHAGLQIWGFLQSNRQTVIKTDNPVSRAQENLEPRGPWERGWSTAGSVLKLKRTNCDGKDQLQVP